MEKRSNRRLLFASKTPACLYCCVSSCLLCCICVLLCTIASRDTATVTTAESDTRGLAVKEANSRTQVMEKEMEITEEKWRMQRRHLTGIGSSPPRCKAKCGKCTPCKPVHVPVPPGISAPTEYYPEAWRCKCGNRLYMPD